METATNSLMAYQHQVSTMVMLWGMEYWKRCTAYAMGALMSDDAEQTDTAGNNCIKVHSHIEAMKRICGEIGLPVESVGQMTGANFDCNLPDDCQPDENETERRYQELVGVLASDKS